MTDYIWLLLDYVSNFLKPKVFMWNLKKRTNQKLQNSIALHCAHQKQAKQQNVNIQQIAFTENIQM